MGGVITYSNSPSTSEFWVIVFFQLIYCLLFTFSSFKSQFLPWEFISPIHILSLSYLSHYLCSLSPSNCFSTASLAKKLQLFRIQLPVQLLNSSRISNQTPSQLKNNVLCFSSAALFMCTGVCACVHAQVIVPMYSIFHPLVCLLTALAVHLFLYAV